MSAEIFICYRRGPTDWAAKYVYDRLVANEISKDKIFIDKEAIPAGVDFPKQIQQAIREIDVMVVIIGEDWLKRKSDEGQTASGDSRDFVRIEVATALKLKKRILPILVGEAIMALPDALPNDLKMLSSINAICITSLWHDHEAAAVVKRIQGILKEVAEVKAEKIKREEAAARKAKLDERRRAKLNAGRMAKLEEYAVVKPFVKPVVKPDLQRPAELSPVQSATKTDDGKYEKIGHFFGAILAAVICGFMGAYLFSWLIPLIVSALKPAYATSINSSFLMLHLFRTCFWVCFFASGIYYLAEAE